jgi:hypothetical protein
VAEYLDYGADAVSVGRPSTDPRVLQRVREAVDDWFDARDAASSASVPDEHPPASDADAR